jgi:polysaccharide export outer membrane protein
MVCSFRGKFRNLVSCSRDTGGGFEYRQTDQSWRSSGLRSCGWRCAGSISGRAIYLVAMLGIVFSFLLAGCAGMGMQEQNAQVPPAVETGTYKIGVDDRIQVSVWRNQELSVIVPVRPDGMISVPLIGDVLAGGKTAPELAADVKEKLAVYVRDPTVTVIVTELRSHEYLSRVRVTGAVRTPRSAQYRQGMTVVDAVLEAGGLNDFAAPNRTKLYRTVDGKPKTYKIDLGDILNSGKLETNMKLFPGDVIAVPERLF